MAEPGEGVEDKLGAPTTEVASVAILEHPSDAATPTPPARRRSRRLLMTGAIAAVLVLGLAVLLILANSALSAAYSPTRATLDYFAAQQRGDVDAMWANASYVRGEGAYSDFFNRFALASMMKVKENRDVRNVKVVSVNAVDANTSTVNVSLSWGGVQRSLQLTVRKDTSNVHWLIYPSWRIEIPSSTIELTLPAQGGRLLIDSIENPPGASRSTVTSIMGYHQVLMGATDLYVASSQTVDAVASTTATLTGTLSETTIAAANTAVRDNLTNSCDAGKYDDCPGHTYTAPDQNFIYYMPVPGHGNVDYTKYTFTLTGNPTSGMTLTVRADPGKVAVSGTCTTTLTVNGRTSYNLKGTFSGTLIWNGGSFDSDLNVYCDQSAS
jgi:hypothetical protein